MSLARNESIRQLLRVLEHGQLLSEIRTDPKMEAADIARAGRLTVAVLKHMTNADRVLGRFVKRMPPLPVMVVLRLAVVELCHFGEAAHGVVNDAVSHVKADRDYSRMSGLVNATLRNIARDGPDIWNALPPPELPKWLRKPLIADYRKAAVKAMEQRFVEVAPLDLTPKGRDGATLAKTLGGKLLPNGSVRLTDYSQVSQLPGFQAGDWWVQDAAAAVPVSVLAPQSGEKILDMCAAPGGKTMQIAAAGAHVTALDRSASRMKRVEENLKRTGLSAELVVEDALKHQGNYDAILLDAPCSATGTLRRHPDLAFAKDGSEFPSLFELQEQMLDHALGLLNPGGRIVFCTCSLLPDEGEIQIEDLLKRQSGIDVTPIEADWIDSDWKTPEGGLRLRPDYWPDLGGMDGFYIAKLRRN